MTGGTGHLRPAMPDTPFTQSITSPVSREVAHGLSIVALRERKKDQTREALARAAFALFQDKGYEATTVAEIARAANVSRRTFFRYYATKDALLFVDNSDYLARFEQLLAASRREAQGFEHVRRACLSLANEYAQSRDRVMARARIIESSQVLSKQERQQDELWEAAITESLLAQDGAMSPRRARMLAAASFGALRATLAEWRNTEGRLDLSSLMSEALELFGAQTGHKNN